MAQAIHCDGADHQDALADVLVSRLENGETSAWCFDHYIDLCRSMVAAAEAAQAEVAAQDSEALARAEAAASAARAKGGTPDGEGEAADVTAPAFPGDQEPGAPGAFLRQGGLGSPEAGEPGEPAGDTAAPAAGSLAPAPAAPVAPGEDDPPG